jgi:hypothetical protein
MGYYMRFTISDDQAIDVEELAAAVLAAGSGYDVVVDAETMAISHCGARVAHIEVNVPADGLFEDERDELMETAAKTAGEESAKARVVDALRKARAMVVAQVLYGTGDSDTTLERLDPSLGVAPSHATRLAPG